MDAGWCVIDLRRFDGVNGVDGREDGRGVCWCPGARSARPCAPYGITERLGHHVPVFRAHQHRDIDRSRAAVCGTFMIHGHGLTPRSRISEEVLSYSSSNSWTTSLRVIFGLRPVRFCMAAWTARTRWCRSEWSSNLTVSIPVRAVMTGLR